MYRRPNNDLPTERGSLPIAQAALRLIACRAGAGDIYGVVGIMSDSDWIILLLSVIVGWLISEGMK